MSISSGSKRLTADKAGHAAADEGEKQSGRWLISYADLITTLMVLFLALYALQLAKNRELELRTLERRTVKEVTDAGSANALLQRPTAPDAARRQLCLGSNR